MYYVDTMTGVKEAVRNRRRDRNAVRSMLNRHVERQYGITDWTEFVAGHISASVASGTGHIETGADTPAYGMLARQVSGVCVEDVACYLLARQAGLTPVSFTFRRDAFNSGSNDKLFRAKVPTLRWSKKQRMVVDFRHVTVPQGGKVPDYGNFSMLRLDRMSIPEGATLPDYHIGVKRSVFEHFPEPYPCPDVSMLYGELLARVHGTKAQPPFVWRSDQNGRDVKSDGYTPTEARALTVRPSSKWYYFLYLSMFLDGRFVLLETYDNEAGGVPEARQLFEKEMRAIRDATSYMPLVVKTYPLRPDMLYVNQHIMDDPTRAAHDLSALHYWAEDTVSATRFYADQVIRFGCPSVASTTGRP